MKKILNIKLIVFIALFSAIFTSCKDSELVVLDVNEGFIQFDKSTASISESTADGIALKVLYGGKNNTNGITVKYTISSEDNSRYSDETNGTIEIPAGEFSGQILLKPLDNIIADGNLNVTISLTNESSLPIGVAGEGVNNVNLALTIIDDDCPIAINDWVGSYRVEEVFSEGGTNAGLSLAGAFGQSYLLELSLDPNDNTGTKLVINNAAGRDVYINNGTILSFDTCNAQVSFSSSPLTLANFAGMTIEENSYSESSFTIECKGPLGNFGAYEFKLTKQ